MGGTSFPGRIQAGRYWRPAFGWSFWFVRKAEEVLLVELHDERFQRVVLEVDDPWRRADEISAALSGAVQ